MTTSPNSPQALPLAAALSRELTDTVDEEPTGPVVGAADAEADRARSGAEADLTAAHHDSDGVPVGAADADADRRASGA